MTTVDDLQNAALVEDFSKEKKIPVVELFGPTIQGEGPLAGSKTMFVRTGGCDYRCKMCDSLHAVLPAAVKANASRMTSREILDQLIPKMKETGTDWVTLSGGNPCMWDLAGVVFGLREEGFYVAVETQGTLAPTWLQHCNCVVISPKANGMGEKFEEEKLDLFLKALPANVLTALKVVVFSALDIELALTMDKVADGRVHARFFSLGNMHPPKLTENFSLKEAVSPPIHLEHLMREYRQLIEIMCNDQRIKDWKFLPQLHVLAFGNEAER
jgi:7-carboxy-7-deazaguanine synthase